MSPRFLLQTAVASLVMSLVLANPSFAQKRPSLDKLAAGKVAADKRAGAAQNANAKEIAKEPVGDRGEDVNPAKELTPAQKAARERLKALEADFRMVDAAIAAHERRIRTVQSIRVPPGVRPPQVDPVPAELLQLRAGLWNQMQQAIRDSK